MSPATDGDPEGSKKEKNRRRLVTSGKVITDISRRMVKDWPSTLADSEQIFRKKERNENPVLRMRMRTGKRLKMVKKAKGSP